MAKQPRQPEAASHQTGELEQIASLDSCPTAFSCTLDLAGVVLAANVAGVTSLGYSIETLLQKPVVQVFHSDDRTQLQEFFTALDHDSTQIMSGVFRLICSNGNSIEVQVAVQMLQGIETSSILLLNCELDRIRYKQIKTKDTSIETLLQQHETLYRHIVEISNEGIWMINADGNTSFVNPRMAEMLGYSPEEMLGMSLFAFMDEEWQAIATEKLNHRQQGLIEQHDFEFCRRDGSKIWVIITTSPILDESGNYAGALAIVMDISDRKQAEIKLKQSEARLRALIENAPFGCWVCDAEGRYVLQNAHDIRHWGDLTGLLPEEVDLPPETSARWQNNHRRAVAGEVVWMEQQYPVDGEIRAFIGVLAPVHSAGCAYGIVGISLDITERKQAEIALQKAREAAEAANYAKSLFLSRVSHELRTPLTAILGFSELLARDSSLRQEHQEYLKIISQSGDYLLKLINNVLEMSKIEAGEVSLDQINLDLYSLLENLEDLLRFKAVSKGLTLLFERSIEVPQFIKTDENKLRQVLINLLNNAVKFTDTGRVILRVKLERIEPVINQPVINQPVVNQPVVNQLVVNQPVIQERTSRTERLCFEIEDTGSGIAPEEIETLFQPFSQTETGRQSQEGTGLGLAISHQFVHLMGGNITVQSVVGQGTRFAFAIPLKRVEVDLARSRVSGDRQISRLAPNQPTYRILVADDQLVTRKILNKILTPIGFEVYEATNGQEAIIAWEQWHPHLIWMDMQMPTIDGYEATQRIRAIEIQRTIFQPQQTRIIALTASAFEEHRKNSLAAGCNDFVTKPFQRNTILEKIAEHLGVQYIYGKAEQPSTANDQPAAQAQPAATAQPDLLSCDSLSVMSAEWIAELQMAVARLNSNRCLKLIEQVPTEHAALADVLSEMVETFRFDTLLEMLQQNSQP